jgi:hypothetical protein
MPTLEERPGQNTMEEEEEGIFAKHAKLIYSAAMMLLASKELGLPEGFQHELAHATHMDQFLSGGNHHVCSKNHM